MLISILEINVIFQGLVATIMPLVSVRWILYPLYRTSPPSPRCRQHKFEYNLIGSNDWLHDIANIICWSLTTTNCEFHIKFITSVVIVRLAKIVMHDFVQGKKIVAEIASMNRNKIWPFWNVCAHTDIRMQRVHYVWDLSVTVCRIPCVSHKWPINV